MITAVAKIHHRFGKAACFEARMSFSSNAGCPAAPFMIHTHTHTHLEVSKEEILRSLPFANDLIGVASFLQQLWKQYFRILNSSYYILRCVCCAKQTKISLTLTIMTANSSRPPITRSIITGSGRAVSLKFQHYHSLEVFPEQEMKGAS